MGTRSKVSSDGGPADEMSCLAEGRTLGKAWSTSTSDKS